MRGKARDVDFAEELAEALDRAVEGGVSEELDEIKVAVG
jgi:hypothetical protein